MLINNNKSSHLTAWFASGGRVYERRREQGVLQNKYMSRELQVMNNTSQFKGNSFLCSYGLQQESRPQILRILAKGKKT